MGKAFVLYLAAAVWMCVMCSLGTAAAQQKNHALFQFFGLEENPPFPPGLKVRHPLPNIAQGQGHTPPTPTQKPKVRPDVVQRMKDKGIVKVGVELNGQWELDPKLSPDARHAQRQAIAVAQQSLISELVGTRHKVLSRSRFGPFLSLEIGADALAVLENSPLVREIYLEEGWGRPALLDSVPLIGGQEAWADGFDGGGQAVAVMGTGADTN